MNLIDILIIILLTILILFLYCSLVIAKKSDEISNNRDIIE